MGKGHCHFKGYDGDRIYSPDTYYIDACQYIKDTNPEEDDEVINFMCENFKDYMLECLAATKFYQENFEDDNSHVDSLVTGIRESGIIVADSDIAQIVISTESDAFNFYVTIIPVSIYTALELNIEEDDAYTYEHRAEYKKWLDEKFEPLRREFLKFLEEEFKDYTYKTFGPWTSGKVFD